MKPLWSNKEITSPIAGIESETEMLRVAELLRYILRFHFTFMARAWGLKMCLPLLSIIQANTLKPIYNSTTGELIQFIGAAGFLLFFFLFNFFLFAIELCCVYSLIPQPKLTPHLDHPTTFTKIQKETDGGKKGFILMSVHSVSTNFTGRERVPKTSRPSTEVLI